MSFLTGPAAELLGKGMQAVGVGIPMCDTGNKVLDGMRNVGIPVPPKSWFKSRPKDQEMVGATRSETPQTIYDKLETHVNGLIQVAKPVIHLKMMVREGCCKSAESRPRDRSRSPVSLKYYTPQKCSSRASALFDEPDSPKQHCSKERSRRRFANKAREDAGHRRQRLNSSDEEESCMYCSRSRSLLQLPCGRLICSKCDKNEDHGLESIMPRTRRARTLIPEPESLPEPLTEPLREPLPEPVVDIIDLTKDSPCNVAFRRSRMNCELQDESVLELIEDSDEIDLDNRSKKPRSKKVPAIVINLDDTMKDYNPSTSISCRKGLCCPICLESLADENIKAMTTPCGHVYCLQCLKKISESKKKCSLCLRSISYSKCIRLHI